ncbi:MAG: hypothetical protein K8T89_16425 [Planctomycetes bacterium]|nr:hypothetical protein [Planctomycetota bacterium]
MRCVVLVHGLILLGLGIAVPLSAQTSARPHLDLVRGLRKENMPDLALQYLDQLKTSTSDPEILKVINLEYARTRLDLAADENDEAKRSALIAQAKRDIETFLKASPDHPQAPQANVELARLISVQGKSLIRKARRFTDKKEQAEEMKKARPFLISAAAMYDKTAKAIEDQYSKVSESKTPTDLKLARELNDFRLTASLDRGITLFSLGDTYVGDELADDRERGKQYTEAKKLFETIMAVDDKLPICWIARAWSGYADIKAGDPVAGEKILADILTKRTNPAAAAGIRVARYFIILNTFENSNKDPRGTLTKLELDTTNWLRDFPSYRETMEGMGARYYLAVAKRELGKLDIQRDKALKITGITPAGKARLEAAEKLFKELTDTENEYTEKATRTRMEILVTLVDAEGKGEDPPAETIPNFERAYLMAQVQAARFNQFQNMEGKKPEDIEKEKVRRFSNAMRYVQQGLKVASPTKDLPRDLFAAQMFLVGCYAQLKLYPQAAVLSEHLAREYPKMSKAATACSYAMSSYSLSQRDLKQLKEKEGKEKENSKTAETDAEVKENNALWEQKFKADQDRLLRVAKYLMTQYPTESAADLARHQVAINASVEKRYDESWNAYAGIRNAYADVQMARYELGAVMYTMVLPVDQKDPATFNKVVQDRLVQYKSQWDTTINLLETVPIPDETASDRVMFANLNNRVQLARLYQLAGDQANVLKTGQTLLKELASSKLAPEQKANLVQIGQNFVLSSIRGQAVALFKEGKHAEVAELLNPKIDEIKKDFAAKGAEETVGFQNLRKTQRSVVILALQSASQDGKIDRASELLDLLENSGGSPEESLNMLASLVSSVRGQLDELEAAKKVAEAKSLKEGFGKLLQKLSAKPNLSLKMQIFLASGLSSVESFDESAKLLEAIRKRPQPAEPKQPGDKATDEELVKFKTDTEDYENFTKYKRQAQMFLARNYRSAKKYPEAIGVYNEIIGGPAVKGVIPKDKQQWGYASLLVRKEKAQVLEELAMTIPAGAPDRVSKWSQAVQEWVGVSQTFARQLPGRRIPLPPEINARSHFAKFFNAKRAPVEGTPDGYLMELAWVFGQYSLVFTAERQKDAEDMIKNAQTRATFFDIFFEQKRCSVMAYKSLGLSAVKGDANVLTEKFAGFAKDFVEVQNPEKNPDLSQDIKNRIKALVDSIPELKAEYNKIAPKQPAGK